MQKSACAGTRMSPLALKTPSPCGLDTLLANPEFHKSRASWRHLNGWPWRALGEAVSDDNEDRHAWGVLGSLGGRLFADGEDIVRFEWSDDGLELHVRLGSARGHVDRHVAITRDGDDEFSFADEGHVHRGHGRLSGDGSVWFYDDVPAHRCRQSGAVYRTTADGRLERQRHYTPSRGSGTVLEPPHAYAACNLYRLGV